jgi:hypothetical protein
MLCSFKLRLRRASPTLGLPSVHRALLGLRRLHAGGAKTLELQRPCCGAVFSAAGFVTREVHVVASRSETIPWNMTTMAS